MERDDALFEVTRMPRTRMPRTLVAAACLLLTAGPLLAAPLSVSGRVLGPDGKPMAEAPVTLKYWSTTPGHQMPTLTTDDTGAFSFSVDDARLYEPATVFVSKPGFAITWAVVRDGEQADLRLSAQTVTCRGVCVDVEGNPLPGATITVTGVMRGPLRHWSESEFQLWLYSGNPLTTTTDANGVFSIPDLPPRCILSVRAAAPGCATQTRYEVPGDADGIRIYLRPEATISGRVTHGGTGVEGVTVSIGYSTAKTAADGSFTLGNLSAGRSAVYLKDAPDDLIVDWMPEVSLATGQTLTDLVVPLTEPITISGVCTDAETGEPVEAAGIGSEMIDLATGVSRGWSAQSDSDGRYELHVLPGNLRFFPRHRMSEEPIWSVRGPAVTMPVEAGKTYDDVNFTVTRDPTVTGTVLGPDGTPVAGAEVGTITRMGVGDVPLPTFFCTRSADDGTYAMEAVEVLVRNGYSSWGFVARDISRGLAGMALPDSVDEPVDIQLQPGAWLLTRIVNRDDQPMTGIAVGLKLADFREYPRVMPAGVSDAEGFVRIGPIPPGIDCAVELGGPLRRFFFNQYEVGDTVQRLEPGDERQLPPIIIDPRGRSVSGTVVDTEGNPVRDALVFGDRLGPPAISGNDGQFTLNGLSKAGMVEIEAIHPTEPLLAGTVVDPDDASPLTLTLAIPGSVTGRVLDAEGNPIPGVMIIHRWPSGVITSPGYEGYPTLSIELSQRQIEAGRDTFAYPGKDGSWMLSGLTAGLDYKLMFNQRLGEYHNQEMTFTAESGVTTDLGDIILQKK